MVLPLAVFKAVGRLLKVIFRKCSINFIEMERLGLILTLLLSLVPKKNRSVRKVLSISLNGVGEHNSVEAAVRNIVPIHLNEVLGNIIPYN